MMAFTVQICRILWILKAKTGKDPSQRMRHATNLRVVMAALVGNVFGMSYHA